MEAAKLADKLSQRSKLNFYNVYEEFEWPPELPRDCFWLSPELLTLYNTEEYAQLSMQQLMQLSHLETINLFSIFAHGESDLLQTILKNCFKPDLKEFKEYLIHFIDEENKHMWFFAEFCRRYDNGVFQSRKFPFESKFPRDVERILGFLRILIFEEIGDFYNRNIIRDNRINAFVKQIHQRHHLDEVGHIAVGWKIAEVLVSRLHLTSRDTLELMRNHIEAYMRSSLEGLYNPDVYRRIGLQDSHDIRQRVITHPARLQAHDAILKRARSRLTSLWNIETTQQLLVRKEKQ